MPITDILSRNASLYAEEISLVEREPLKNIRREITWKEFDQEANQFAQALQLRGVKKGDKVALLMMNCLEWLPIYFGILRTGALAVPLNFRFSADEIKRCLETAEAQILVYGPEFVERVEQIRDKIASLESLIFVGTDCPTGTESYRAIIDGMPVNDPGINISDDDEAALYFTSGTTGVPKAIILTHSNLVASCFTENNHHGQTHGDNFLCIPPLYHCGAKMHWFGSLLVGAKAVLLRGVDPRWVLEAVSEEGITIVWLLVPWAQDILDAIDSGQLKLHDYHLSQWRLLHIGAQPVPPSLVLRWKKVFPHHDYDTNYGLSEATGPGCVHLGTENINKVGAIGVPGYGWETRIIDEHGMNVPRGKVGELLVKGPGVMKGYYKNPEATEAILRDNWLHTGDMARQDKDGFIYLVDRKKDLVISGGENIFPVEIEDFLRAHQDIKDAAVIGVPDRRLGEIAVAVIELKPDRNLTAEEVMQFCMELPRYKRPRLVFFEPVPRNATGKIEKPKLREKYCAEEIAEVI
ncbi:MAG: class I adenylate-forming enzyme family protein [Methylocystaceae bacterium]